MLGKEPQFKQKLSQEIKIYLNKTEEQITNALEALMDCLYSPDERIRLRAAEDILQKGMHQVKYLSPEGIFEANDQANLKQKLTKNQVAAFIKLIKTITRK